MKPTKVTPRMIAMAARKWQRMIAWHGGHSVQAYNAACRYRRLLEEFQHTA